MAGRRPQSHWTESTSCKCGAPSYLGHLMRIETGEAKPHVYGRGAPWAIIDQAEEVMRRWRERRAARSGVELEKR